MMGESTYSVFNQGNDLFSLEVYKFTPTLLGEVQFEIKQTTLKNELYTWIDDPYKNLTGLE